jgi:peroxiredoxin
MRAETTTLIIMALLGLALFASYSTSSRSVAPEFGGTQIVPLAPELEQIVWVDSFPASPDGSSLTVDDDVELPEPGKLPTDSSIPEGTEVGRLAPDFALPDLEGNVIRLSELRGHFVLINFWASYCPYSRVELSLLETLRADHPELVILGINVGEEIETIREVTREVGASYPALLDDKGKIATAYRVFKLPATFFLDEQGVIVWKTFQAMSEAELEEQVQSHLGERSP